MTETTLEKAKSNRKFRSTALCEYQKVSEAINVFNDDGFHFCVRIKTYERGDWKDIYPSSEEFLELLKQMRDRYDREISVIDKEFEDL